MLLPSHSGGQRVRLVWWQRSSELVGGSVPRVHRLSANSPRPVSVALFAPGHKIHNYDNTFRDYYKMLRDTRDKHEAPDAAHTKHTWNSLWLDKFVHPPSNF
ncbi:unnamed protein product [Pleuronectes platessa]|uniref:Uncharacterized protein n=1 Tax=Pleuronectes platessa TaxID=8262 RepID=A0A9N7VA83_PLEPL|nr:unnamed protein product [Pleuronectes platessa]